MGGDNIFNAITGNYDKIGGGYAPQATTTNQDILDMYLKNLPGIFNVTNDPAQADKMSAANLAQLQKYGLASADVGNAITAANAKSGADINKTLLAGTGAENARLASALDKEINPTLYKSREGAGRLIDSINLEGLSGGERAEVERSLNKSNTATGNLGLDNATNAVRNAMMFGDRLTQKRGELNQYVNTGLNAAQGGVNATGVALTGTSAPQTNFGTSTFSSASDTAKQNQTLGTSLLGNLSQVAAASIAPNTEASWKNSDRYAMDQIGANS